MGKTALIILMLAWSFGVGFTLIKYPVAIQRIFLWGREPTTRELKIAKTVGYGGVVFGCLLVLELIFGIVSPR
jgi:hypothetical protein